MNNKIILIVNNIHIDFIRPYVKKYKNIGLYIIDDNIPKLILNYINNNINIKLIDKFTPEKINEYQNAITFDYNLFILDQIKYIGKIIHYGHGISRKPYYPTDLFMNKINLFCIFAKWHKNFLINYLKKSNMQKYENKLLITEYLKKNDIEPVKELKDINIENSILITVTIPYTKGWNFYNYLNNILKLNKDHTIYILLHPYYLLNIDYYNNIISNNIYFINRAYYRDNIVNEKNVINITELTTSMDIINCFKYIVCEESTTFFESMMLNKKIYYIDSIEKIDKNIYILDNYKQYSIKDD